MVVPIVAAGARVVAGQLAKEAAKKAVVRAGARAGANAATTAKITPLAERVGAYAGEKTAEKIFEKKNQPEQSSLTEENRQTLPQNIINLLDFKNTNVDTSPTETNPRQAQFANDNILDETQPQNYPDQIEPAMQMAKIEEQRNSKIELIHSKLKKIYPEFTLEETKKLIQGNFKVRFPWELVFGNVFRGFIEFMAYMSGQLFTILGLGAQLIPIVGTILGGFSAGIGLAVIVFTFLFGVVLATVLVYLQYRYSQTASDALYKSPKLRGFFYKYFMRRIAIRYFGSITPFVGWLINLVTTILMWRYIKKKVAEVETICKQPR